MDLKEWTRLFLKHQDVVRREIIEIIEHEKDGCTLFQVKKKNGDEHWYIVGHLESVLEHIDPQAKQGVVCLNTKENVEILHKNWKVFADHPTLKIVFTHPEKNERWMIVPHHHARVADDESLKTGLEAMFGSIPAHE